MVTIDLKHEEIKQIIIMMESASVQLANAEPEMKLLTKFRMAEKS